MTDDLQRLTHKKLSSLNKPFYLESQIKLFNEKWRKRYVIWKDEYLYFYESNKPNNTPTELFLITENTKFQIDHKEKKPICKFILEDGGEMQIQANKNEKEFERAFFQCKKDIKEKQDRKVKEMFKTMNKPETTQYLIPWNTMENKIKNRGKLNGNDLLGFFDEIGTKNANEYFYDIVAVASKNWEVTEYVEFGFKQFCKEDFEFFISFLVGFSKLAKTKLFTFGNETEDFNKIMSVFMEILKYKQWDFVEWAKNFLLAIGSWEITSDKDEFCWMIGYLVTTMNPIELVCILKFLYDYEIDIGLPDWSEQNERIQKLFVEITNRWENEKEKIAEMFDIIKHTWGWDTEQLNLLKSTLNL